MSERDIAAEIDALAKRIEAIERAATCGTGPNEPRTLYGRQRDVPCHPAQADVGEVSAESNAQPPCRCVRCLTERNDPCVVPFHTRMIVCACCGNKRCPHATDHRYKCTGSNDPGQEGSRFGQSEARIAAARGEKPRLDDAFPIPAKPATCLGTTEHGLPMFDIHEGEGDADTAQPPFAVGQVVECVDAGVENGVENGERYTVKAIRKAANPKDAWLVDVGNGGSVYAFRFRAIPATVEQGPTTGMKAVIDHACIGAVASGSTLLRIVVQYVGPEFQVLQQQLSAATAADAERDRAAEAMGWMDYTRCKLLFGYNSSIEKGWFVDGTFNGVYSTPTDAILAAKAASGTNTGERT